MDPENEFTHVIGSPSMLEAASDEDLEIVLATEDDLEDDCPMCLMLRDKIRAGEKVGVLKLRPRAML